MLLQYIPYTFKPENMIVLKVREWANDQQEIGYLGF